MEEVAPINIESLKKMLSGEQLQAIFDLFIREAGSRLSQLKVAIDSRDVKTVALHVHTLKGSSATITANDFAQLCKDMEQANKELDWDAARDIHKDLAVELSRLENYIKKCKL